MLEGSKYVVKQKVELVELLGYEARNKYHVLDGMGQTVLFVAEEGKSIVGALARQLFGHRQKLNLSVFNSRREKVLDIRHPYSFFFQRIHVHNAHGELLGTCVHRFGFFRRRMDVLDANGAILMQMRTSMTWFVTWSYPLWRNDQVVAQIDKKFSGFLQEISTDADSFLISFQEVMMSMTQRSLVLSAAILIDLLFFETNSSGCT